MRYWPVLVLSLVSSDLYAAQVLTLNDPTQEPYTTDKQDGLLDVVAGEAFRRVKVQLRLIRLPAERGLRNSNAGLEDGDLSRIAGLEKLYPNLLRVKEKLYDMKFVAFTRSRSIRIRRWEDLRPYRVAMIKGWKIFEQNVPAGTRLNQVRDAGVLFTMFAKRRVDVILYSRAMGEFQAKKMALNDVQVQIPPLAQRAMFIYLHKKHRSLVRPLEAALRQIKQEVFYRNKYREAIYGQSDK